MCEFIAIGALSGATIYFAGRLGEYLGAQRDTKRKQESLLQARLRELERTQSGHDREVREMGETIRHLHRDYHMVNQRLNLLTDRVNELTDKIKTKEEK